MQATELIQRAREEMVDEPKVGHMLVRCRGCGYFVLRANAAMGGCKVCDWYTVRCQDCGGEKSVQRAVLIHHGHFAGQASEKFGNAHVRTWESYKKRREGASGKAKLAVLRGGRK